jgi:hypothetical protein
LPPLILFQVGNNMFVMSLFAFQQVITSYAPPPPPVEARKAINRTAAMISQAI